MTTPTEVLRDLAAKGYEANLWIAEDGSITSGSTSWSPGSIVVRDITRFEGRSDPSDETIILAVEIDGKPLGALSLPYGPETSAAQAETLRLLDEARPTN